MSDLSDELEEALASGDEGAVDLIVVEIDHDTFADPILVVTGDDDDQMLPVADGGDPKLHKAVAFEYVPPGFDEDGPTDGKLRIDNVSGELNEHLQQATGSNSSLRITIRRFHITPEQSGPITTIDEEVRGLIIRSVTLTATMAEGTLTYPDVREENFPKAIYTPEEYPGLVGM